MSVTVLSELLAQVRVEEALRWKSLEVFPLVQPNGHAPTCVLIDEPLETHQAEISGWLRMKVGETPPALRPCLVHQPGRPPVACLPSSSNVNVERDGEVLVVDFKTDAPPPAGAGVAGYPEYRRQLELYVEALRVAGVVKERSVRAGLAFTKMAGSVGRNAVPELHKTSSEGAHHIVRFRLSTSSTTR